MKVLKFYGSLLNAFERGQCQIEADAKAESRKKFKHKQAEKLYETGLVHLVRVCEELLSSNHMLDPAILPTLSTQVPRWMEGRRGWTGLEPADIDL